MRRAAVCVALPRLKYGRGRACYGQIAGVTSLSGRAVT